LESRNDTASRTTQRKHLHHAAALWRKFAGLPRWQLVAGSVVLGFAMQIGIASVARAIFGMGETHVDALEGKPVEQQWLLGVLMAPLAETLLFQWLPLRLLRRALQLPWSIACPLSALAFAFAHGYSGREFLSLLSIGAILCGVFAIESQKAKGRPFWTTFAVHSLFNALVRVIIQLDL